MSVGKGTYKVIVGEKKRYWLGFDMYGKNTD